MKIGFHHYLTTLNIRRYNRLDKIIAKNNIVKVLLTLLIPFAIILIRPISLDLKQSIILGALFLVIVWWGTEWVHKDVASALLITVFLIFSGAGVTNVLNFPCSTNIVMIVAAYLLSQGIVNSGIAEQFSNYCIRRFCRNGRQLAVMSFVLAVLLLVVIPQPFPRVVLLATIYSSYLKKHDISEDSRSVLLLSLFIAVPVTSLLLLNGDVIVNYAAMGFADVSLSFTEWAKYMFAPTAGVAVVMAIVYMPVFRKELDVKLETKDVASGIKIGRQGVSALVIMCIVITLWLTESIHGIDPSIVALLGTVLMFIVRIVHIKDFKVISLSLLLFLTAEFSIGRSLIGSGVAEKIKEAIVPLLPPVDDFWFIPVIAALIMILHMVMGSVVTAISFSIPMVVVITEGFWEPEFAALFVLVIVAFQFILPFHNINIMIGYGGGYYKNSHTLKIGLVITAVTYAALFLIYIPWWKLTGLM